MSAAAGISKARVDAKKPTDITCEGNIKDCNQNVLKMWLITSAGQRLSEERTSPRKSEGRD